MFNHIALRGRIRLATVKVCVGLAATAAATVGLSGAALAEPQPGLDKLQGSWVVEEAERQLLPLKTLKGGVLTITGNKFTVERGILDTWMGDLKVEPSSGKIDFLHQGEQMVAPVKGDRWEGRYRVSGDTLEIVTTTGHDARPTAFRTGYDITLMKLRRR
jgi:uncharacterized protein (TIGR03067 family)